jgi:outer membrane protein OmpA-like peptidoglycan-associated protein
MTISKLVFRRIFLCAIAIVCTGLLGCQNGPSSVKAGSAAVAGKLSDVQVAELRRLGFNEESEGWTFNISDSKLLFDFGHHTLSAKGSLVVDDISRALIQVGLTKIRTEGHTDNVGSQEFNKVLSLQRAEHVAKKFVLGGFQDANVIRKGFGSTKPVADNASAEGRAQNRRVTLIIVVD